MSTEARSGPGVADGGASSAASPMPHAIGAARGGRASTDGDLGWLLTGLVAKVPGIASALVVSSDGLPLALSDELGSPATDQLAAIASGLASPTQGAARCLDGGAVRQILIEMDHRFLFVNAISGGAVLAVQATTDADLGLVAYEIEILVARVGAALTPCLR